MRVFERILKQRKRIDMEVVSRKTKENNKKNAKINVTTTSCQKCGLFGASGISSVVALVVANINECVFVFWETVCKCHCGAVLHVKL